jgi:hypothetical protein
MVWRNMILAAAFALLASDAAGAETLAQAVAKADAEHVEAPQPDLPPDESPRLTTGWDEEPGQGQTRSIASKGVKVAVTYRKVEEPAGEADAGDAPDAEPAPPGDDAPPPGETGEAETPEEDDPLPGETAEAEAPEEEEPLFQIPIVTITAGGRQVAKLEGGEVPPVGVQIVEMQGGNRYPEVVVSFYTGGAHCCSITKVVSANRSGRAWSVIDVGQFDGGPQLATDLDGDGRFEFADRDNEFLYAFGCYACSTAPLKILRLDDDKIETVSADPVYRASHVGWLKEMVAQAQAAEVDANAWLAGYVAQKILLGEGAEAWAIMEKHYDKANAEGLEQCDQLRSADGSCPGRTVSGNYPESLARFLDLRGYPARF